MIKNFSVGIDIGTYQIKVVVASNSKEIGQKTPEVLGVGFAESKGLRHGYIINSSDVAKSLKMAISQAEHSAKVKIRGAYLSVGGMGLSSIISKGSIMTSKADMEITDADVKNVLEVAENEIPQASIINKKIIHSIPVSYKIDGQTIMGRPNNMRGNKLEVKALFVVCIEQHLDDLIKAVEKTGIDVWDIMASPIAGSLVTLNKNQKTAGCVLANIGSETVSIVVFENNTPISLEIFPIGGTDITNDIALGLRISLSEAEQIKVSSVEPNFSKKKLEEIIMARLSDIFELIEAHLKKIGRNGLLPAGIILTGGGSGIGSIEDMAKLSLKLPSRIASVNFISNSKNTQIKDSSWSVAYGLATWGLNNIGDIPEGVRIPSNAGNKIIEWFKRSIQQFLP